MFLSKIFIPWQKARNPYDIHRELWHLFPNRPDESRGFLFRVEKQQKGLGAEILMQSNSEVSAVNGTVRIIGSRKYVFSLQKGQKIRFRLRANPIKTIKDEDGRLNQRDEMKKCRVPLIREGDQKAWIERKLEKICSLDALVFQQEMPLYFRKSNSKRAGKIQTVLFDGVLNINDPDALIEMIKNGIGPAKAFGCGLLSMARF